MSSTIAISLPLYAQLVFIFKVVRDLFVRIYSLPVVVAERHGVTNFRWHARLIQAKHIHIYGLLQSLIRSHFSIWQAEQLLPEATRFIL